MRKAKVYMYNELAGFLTESEEGYSFVPRSCCPQSAFQELAAPELHECFAGGSG